MRLHSLQFTENEGTLQEWVLEGLTLASKNLIVGRNASGKSRTLNVINAFARNLAGLQPPARSGKFDCLLYDDSGKAYQYLLQYENQQIISEKLLIDDKAFLVRGAGGVGTIFAEKVDGGSNIPFQAPTSEFAAVVRRDNIQHSFLEPLYEWASSVRHYQFGSALGKDNFAVFHDGAPTVDERDPNAVVGIFRNGKREFPDEFTSALISDLASIDYHVDHVDIGPPVSASFNLMGMPGALVGLFVKEKDLPGITDQISMSQGMFRVLSLLIHLNYFQLKKTATCVLVDDIGEGLDFDRSCRLIELLRLKASNSNIQIILSTNDRFVMNQVPLEEWSILQRKGNHIKVRNNSNSHDVFEEFKFTGLSNFSFLELDIINEPHDGGGSPSA